MRDHGEESILRAVGTLGERASVALPREGLLALVLELLSPVMSRAIFAPPTIRPVRSLIGDTESEMYPAAVLRDALGLEVVDAFSPDERAEDCCLFLKPVGLEAAW